MLETVKGFDSKYHSIVYSLEWIITIFFSLEYILRIAVINKPRKYILSFYGIIDLISILPMYLSFFIAGTSVFSLVRALRLLRLFKILNHPQFNHQSVHLRNSLVASRGKIVVFIYFVLISTIIIGSIMYVVEGEEGGFTSIPTGIYWAIVTLTTVGYGDISPITPLGQFIASVVMVLGYGIIAVPTGIITAEIAKNSPKLPEPTHKICHACQYKENSIKAKFCMECGQPLSSK